jgi:hypothetical protein
MPRGRCRASGQAKLPTGRVRLRLRELEKPPILRVSGSFGFFARVGPRVRSASAPPGFVRTPAGWFSRDPRLDTRLGVLTHFRCRDYRDLSPTAEPGGNAILTMIQQRFVRVVHATVGIRVAPRGLPAQRGGSAGEARRQGRNIASSR